MIKMNMMIIFLAIVVVVVLLALFESKRQDCKRLERDYKKHESQQDHVRKPICVDDVDNRLLTKESVMEAIRYNGYVPDADECWVTFMVQGGRYSIDVERLPVLTMIKHYNLDRKEWDMDLMHKAAHQVSDELIMGKVLFTGEEEDGIDFQISAIENKYGHFKDCLTRYISIIEESQARMSKIYNDMDAKRKEGLSLLPQLGAGVQGEKKVLS